MLRRLLVFCFLPLLAVAAPEVDYVQPFPDVQFRQPVLVTHAPGDDAGLYVVEQPGRIQRLDRETGEVTTFFALPDATENKFTSGGEEGLLGLAFDPEFQTNGYFYLNYSALSPRRTVVARWQLADKATGVVDLASETSLLEIAQDFRNHNGGMIAFGMDGLLYVGMGDGGSAGDPNHRAQDGRSLLGKMLRVTREGQPAPGNPFLNNGNVRDEVWALGLRNPWRFSFDRSNGELWLGDVGQNALEEINLIRAGRNYGWRWYEGTREYELDDSARGVALTDPVFEYPHSEGSSVTGGYVYRGTQNASMVGWYFFGDFVSGSMWALNSETYQAIELPDFANPSSFGEDAAGELYVLSYRGQLFQIVERDN